MNNLRQACQTLKKAAEEGFDWESALGPAQKVQEELEEVKEVLRESERPNRQEALEEEIGDLFLASCCLARHCKVDPEEAISVALEKFDRRYAKLKAYMQEENLNFQTMTIKEIVVLWQNLKNHKKG